MFLNPVTSIDNSEEEILLELAEFLNFSEEDLDIETLDDTEILSESLRSKSRIIRSKHEKFAALVGSTAAMIARKKNDPLAKKLQKINAIRRTLKTKIKAKYSKQAVSLAKQVLRKSLKAPQVQPPKVKEIDES